MQEAECIVEFQQTKGDVAEGRWWTHDYFPLSEAIMQAQDLKNSALYRSIRVRLYKDIPAHSKLPASIILWLSQETQPEPSQQAPNPQYEAYIEATDRGQDTGRD